MKTIYFDLVKNKRSGTIAEALGTHFDRGENVMVRYYSEAIDGYVRTTWKKWNVEWLGIFRIGVG